MRGAPHSVQRPGRSRRARRTGGGGAHRARARRASPTPRRARSHLRAAGRSPAAPRSRLAAAPAPLRSSPQGPGVRGESCLRPRARLACAPARALPGSGVLVRHVPLLSLVGDPRPLSLIAGVILALTRYPRPEVSHRARLPRTAKNGPCVQYGATTIVDGEAPKHAPDRAPQLELAARAPVAPRAGGSVTIAGRSRLYRWPAAYC